MSREISGNRVVMVGWVSIHHRALPFLSAIDAPESPYRGRVQKLYLCHREAASPDGARERDALRETLEELRTELKPVCPQLIPLAWKTSAPPTEHAAIRIFSEDALKRVREENPETEIVIHLSPGTPAMHAVWLVLGATGFVNGDVVLIQTSDERGRAAGLPPVQKVPLKIDTWLRRFRSTGPMRTAKDDDGHLWDPAKLSSPKLVATLKQLQEWAPLRVPVLLVGERGTGKTTMANFLRAMSPFQKELKGEAKWGWPVVVCGQFRVNPNMARSELFGHVRGAFTGADKERVGLVEEANGDSLFLDEIADLDRDTQRLLMAAVEGRGFHRLGEQKVRHSSFRLISATNKPLHKLRGAFLDEDFFDRIAIFVVEVPPLRMCRDDLPHLWRETLTRSRLTAGVMPEGWERFLDHAELMAVLRTHALPGNLRDLQRAAFHLLSALFAGHDDKTIVNAAKRALDLEFDCTEVSARRRDLSDLSREGGLRAWLDENRDEWIRLALKVSGGNKTEAARLLGLARKTFEHWRKRVPGED